MAKHKPNDEFFHLTTVATLDLDGAESNITVSTNFNIHPDCPPHLVNVMMQAIGKFVAETQTEENAIKIAADLAEIRERRQRRADIVARQLLGDDEANGGDT